MSEPATPPAVNEHGFPDATPVADMEPVHQVAYWKHQSRKHEAAVKASPSAEELAQMRADAAELATRKAAELSETDRLKAEKAAADALVAAAQAEAATATRRALLLEVAAEKGLTPAQAARLQGATKEELTADADALKAMFPAAAGTPQAPRVGGAQGGDVKPAKSVSAGAELWKSRNPK